MKKFIVVLAGIFVVILTTTANADGIKEGKWSMTMVTKMEGMSGEMADAMKEMENMPAEAKAMMQGMPGMNFQMGGDAQGITTTVTQCVTNKNPVPEASSTENCQQTHEIDGSTVNFHVTCNNKNDQTDSTGRVTYAGDSMEGAIKSHQKSDGQNTDAAIQITGKYLGPC